MKKHITSILLLLNLFVASSCANKFKVPPPNEGFYLPPRKVGKLTTKALSGDKHAPMMLYEYYCFYRGWSDIAIGWLEVAAHNGDTEAQYILGSLLLELEPKDSRNEGMEWLRKAASGGHQEASKLLRNE